MEDIEILWENFLEFLRKFRFEEFEVKRTQMLNGHNKNLLL